MPKFFVPEAAPGARFLVLTGENAAHAKVLRLKARRVRYGLRRKRYGLSVYGE